MREARLSAVRHPRSCSARATGRPPRCWCATKPAGRRRRRRAGEARRWPRRARRVAAAGVQVRMLAASAELQAPRWRWPACGRYARRRVPGRMAGKVACWRRLRCRRCQSTRKVAERRRGGRPPGRNGGAVAAARRSRRRAGRCRTRNRSSMAPAPARAPAPGGLISRCRRARATALRRTPRQRHRRRLLAVGGSGAAKRPPRGRGARRGAGVLHRECARIGMQRSARREPGVAPSPKRPCSAAPPSSWMRSASARRHPRRAWRHSRATRWIPAADGLEHRRARRRSHAPMSSHA